MGVLFFFCALFNFKSYIKYKKATFATVNDFESYCNTFENLHFFKLLKSKLLTVNIFKSEYFLE
jgi:hypothetical protein